MRKNVAELDSFTTFGDLLKYLRIRSQLTQRDLSIAVGYSEAQISRQEGNKRVPSEHTLKALFVPALGLEDEPEIIARLLALADQAQEKERPWIVSNPEKNPSLRTTAQPVLHNLPRPISSFVGREKELEQVVGLVRDHRLVTLTGTGGVGKTRLALHAAQELDDGFPDGIWLVELAPVIDPVFVPIAVASLFNIHSAPMQRLAQTLREYFASKCLLLILDNCEHVIESVAEFSTRLLECCPKLSILATSREILDVEGEFFYRCPSLTLPDPLPEHPTIQLLKRAESSEAVQLFLHRAAAASPGFCLTEMNAPTITAICRRLDGIPLAIELAAARLRLLSLEQIAGYMNNVFGLLAGSRRTAQPRHKTLKALIDWSYELLSPSEQILLRRLSVFTGGWTLPAADAVAGGYGIEIGEVLDRMQQLVDKSLILVETTEFGENRYRMLETIRQYAAEKLQEAGEYRLTRDRHLEFFVHMAEQRNPPNSPHIVSTHDGIWMMKDFDNVRLALAWSLDTNIELGLRLCLSFVAVIPFHLYFEIGTWLEKLMEAEAADQDHLGAQRDKTQIDFLRGSALAYIGESSYLWGQRSRSEQALLKSITILESIGEPADYLRAYAQMNLGTLLICTDPERSRAYLESSRESVIRMGRRNNLPDFVRKLSALNLLIGNLDQARQFADEDLTLSMEFYDVVGPPPLEYRGCVEWLLGKFERAIEYFHQGMESGIAIRSFPQAAYVGWMEGCAALAQGSPEHLLCLREDMLILGQETGSSAWFFYADALLAMLEWTQGEYEQAVKRSEEGLGRYSSENLSFTVPFPYVLGRVALNRGELARAEQYFRQMDEMANAPPVWRWKPVSLHVFGILAAAQATDRPRMAERAAVLFGAQEKLFAWLPNVLSPFERKEYARALAGVKECLGEEAFFAAFACGQAMSYRQAFALALEENPA